LVLGIKEMGHGELTTTIRTTTTNCSVFMPLVLPAGGQADTTLNIFTAGMGIYTSRLPSVK
jgi:hypothetical protein